ncbi:MAG: hypothetical protein QXJ69_04675 [Desulfurococcaceae archaeon]
MAGYEVALRLYRVIGEKENDLDTELKKLSEILKTRSQLNKDVEYLSISKISKGDVKGLIVIKGEKEKALNEAQLLTTLIKSSFKTIDVESFTTKSLLTAFTTGLKNFF